MSIQDDLNKRVKAFRVKMAHKLSKPLHIADETLHPFYFGFAAMELPSPFWIVAATLAIVFALNFIIGASGGGDA